MFPGCFRFVICLKGAIEWIPLVNPEFRFKEVIFLTDGLREQLVRIDEVGWMEVGFLNMDGHIVGGYGGIVHICLIVFYFTKSADVIVFRKNGL
jgi:hypothetical protein